MRFTTVKNRALKKAYEMMRQLEPDPNAPRGMKYENDKYKLTLGEVVAELVVYWDDMTITLDGKTQNIKL